MSSAPPPGFPPLPQRTESARGDDRERDEKKGMSGCAIAVIVLVVLTLAAVAAGAALFFAVLRSPEGKAVGEMFSIAVNAASGPGPDALRAGGCDQAMVVSIAKMQAIAERLAPDGGPAEVPSGPDEPKAVVTCVDPTRPLTCDDVAVMYLKADRPGGRFSVTITRRQEQVCAFLYDGDGRRLQPWGPPPSPVR